MQAVVLCFITSNLGVPLWLCKTEFNKKVSAYSYVDVDSDDIVELGIV